MFIVQNTSLAAKGALAHRLQRRTACNTAPPEKSKMAARGSQNKRGAFLRGKIVTERKKRENGKGKKEWWK